MSDSPPLPLANVRGFDEADLSFARLIAIVTPVALLGGAFISQYMGGLYPCEMCVWQRWPHAVAIIFALDASALRRRPPLSALFAALAAVAIAVSGAIGVFHAGVEYGWWEGVTACTATVGNGSTQDVMNAIMAAPITRCDVAPWTLWGISLAGFNAIFSLGAALLIFLALAKARQDVK